MSKLVIQANQHHLLTRVSAKASQLSETARIYAGHAKLGVITRDSHAIRELEKLAITILADLTAIDADGRK